MSEHLYHIPAGSLMKRTTFQVGVADVSNGMRTGIMWMNVTSTRAVTYTNADVLTEVYEHVSGNSQLMAWHLYFRLPKSAHPYKAIRAHQQYVYQTNVT